MNQEAQEAFWWVVENWEFVAAVMAAVHTLAVAIVNLTPTPDDNILLGKVYRVVEAFAGILTATAKEYPAERKIMGDLKR